MYSSYHACSLVPAAVARGALLALLTVRLHVVMATHACMQYGGDVCVRTAFSSV